MKHLQTLLAVSISSYESNFVAYTVGLHFCKMPLKYNVLVLVLDCNRFLKFIVFSPCKPGAVKKTTKIFCLSFASCVLLGNNWAVINRWQLQHYKTEELVKNWPKRSNSASNSFSKEK